MLSVAPVVKPGQLVGEEGAGVADFFRLGGRFIGTESTMV